MTHTILIILSLVLVFLNGFFVAAEFAIVRLRATQLDEILQEEALKGKFLKNIHQQMDTYLSSCQLGITLTSIGLGWLGEPAVAQVLKPIFHWSGLFSPTTISIISFSVAYFIISFFHIVLGELVPKSFAIRFVKSTAIWTAIPLTIFHIIFYPIIALLNICTNCILKLFKVDVKEVLDPGYSIEELKKILKAGHLPEEEIDPEEIDILMQVLEFTELLASDLMRPADEMISLCLEHSMSETLEIIKNNRFSRYPVYSVDPNNIIGILHIKDLLIVWPEHNIEKVNISQYLRKPIIVYENYFAIDVFNQFKKGMVHFAIVKNKHDLVIGFITLDNVLTVLLGNIRDEFNKIRPDWLFTESGALLMKGSTPLYILEKALGIEIESSAHTINGLLMDKLERLPKANEIVSFPEFEVVVYRIQGPKVTLVKIYKKNY